MGLLKRRKMKRMKSISQQEALNRLGATERYGESFERLGLLKRRELSGRTIQDSSLIVSRGLGLINRVKRKEREL